MGNAPPGSDASNTAAGRRRDTQAVNRSGRNRMKGGKKSGAGGSLGADELRNLSRSLARMAEEVERALKGQGSKHPNSGQHKLDPADSLLPRMAEYEYRNRRRRTELFDEKFFGEPAWDMLLDLFINRANGQKVATTSLCIASGVPPTTALRWIGVLEEKGLVRRSFSERDQRVNYVELTEEGAERVAGHFRERLRQLS